MFAECVDCRTRKSGLECNCSLLKSVKVIYHSGATFSSNRKFKSVEDFYGWCSLVGIDTSEFKEVVMLGC